MEEEFFKIIENIINNTKDIEPEYAKIINDNFKELISEEED